MADSDMPPLLQKLHFYSKGKNRIRGEDIQRCIGQNNDFIDLMSNSIDPAISEPLNLEKTPCSHYMLKKFIQTEFSLSDFGIYPGDRIAIIIPNGPELAVALLCTISEWCAVPINPTNTWEEIRSELESTRAVAIMVMAGVSTNDAALKAANLLGLGLIVLNPSGTISGLFRLSQLVSTSKRSPTNQSLASNHHNNRSHVAMLLHTSGTSGNKKLVAYTLETLIVGVACIVMSWELTPSDICLNMMPLFHIGGIVRNVLSPILSGGQLIACSGFDPIQFWDILYSGTQKFTWYYASPTCHHAILNEAENRLKEHNTDKLPVESVRFIANAAGGLLPVLAESLRKKFNATILTSYGMTEW